MDMNLEVVVGGIMIPTSPRVHVRNPDDSPTLDSVSAADITDVTLRRDLREVTREIRPDWDLAAPGLRENWEADRSMHPPYQHADRMRTVTPPLVRKN